MKKESNEFKFKERRTRSLGRNGASFTEGIHISSSGLDLDIYPINSKGDVTKCRITIPREDIPTFIEKLKEIL
jgi:hypothetical protein